MKRRILSFILALTFLLPQVPVSVFASESTADAYINVEQSYGEPGTSVAIDINIDKNPGIAGITLTVSYDSALTLAEIENGAVLSEFDFTYNKNLTDKCILMWDSLEGEISQTGTIATLTFDISEDAEIYTDLPINVSYRYGDIYSEDEDWNVEITSGNIKVLDYIPGDVFEDKVINTKDVRLLRQYLVMSNDIPINEKAADVNDDGIINSKDTRAIRRYIAGGYGVVLLPHTERCQHTNLTPVAAKEATCIEDGNIAYWSCECGKYFEDEDATTEIALADTVVEANGHTPGSEATCTVPQTCTECNEVLKEATGHTYSTEWTIDDDYHWHASTCGHSDAVADKERHNLENGACVCSFACHSISYYNYNGADISTMPTVYAENKGAAIPDISKDGYTFLGWYEQGNDTSRIYSIPKGSTKDYILVAKWEAKKYSITYKEAEYGFKTTKIETFTVENEVILPEPNWPGLIFLHWEDEDGNEITKIPKGTIGNVTVTATWRTNRNIVTQKSGDRQLVSVTSETNDKYYFLYEIGTIDNVVLENYVSGSKSVYDKNADTERTLELSESLTFDESIAESTANTLLIATSRSLGWENTYENIKQHVRTITHGVNAGVGAGLSVKAIKAINVELGYSFTNSNTQTNTEGYKNSTSGEDYYGNEISQTGSTTISYSTSFQQSEKTTDRIPSDAPNGVYHFTRLGDIRVFALVEYDAINKLYSMDTYSVIENVSESTIYYRNDEERRESANIDTISFEIPFEDIFDIVESSYYVKYDKNGGTGEMPMSVHGIGKSSTLLNNVYEKDGYSFASWEARTGSSTKIYEDGASVTDLTTAGNTITLYAHWTPIAYKIVYNANTPGNASNVISNMPASSDWKYDQDSTLATAPFLNGWTFGGWYKEADCKTKVGDGGAKLAKPNLTNIAGKEVHLYAKWTANKITVTYNANGGSVSTSTETKTFDSEYGTMPTPTRAEYKFLGWYTNANFTTKVDANTKVTTASNHILYAKWVRTSYTWNAPLGREYEYVENKNGYVAYTESTTGKLDKQALISAGYTAIKVYVEFKMKEKDNCYEYLKILGHEQKYEATNSYQTYYFTHDYSLSNSGIDNSCNITLEFYCYDNDWISDIVYLGDTKVTVTALK